MCGKVLYPLYFCLVLSEATNHDVIVHEINLYARRVFWELLGKINAPLD